MTVTPLWWLIALVAALAIVWLIAGISHGALRTGPWLRGFAVLALVAVIATQPALAATDEPAEAPAGLDVVLVIDRTTSMGAEDYDGDRPRMDGVAADVTELVSRLGAARYSAIVSDNEATQALPWTTDARAVTSLAQTVGWRDESYGTGSDIAAAEPLATQLLSDSAATRPEAHRLLVYLGDGEQTSPEAPSSFAPAAAYLDGALVLGYGTTEGGRMRTTPDSDEYVTRDGSPQISRIDEDNLRQIAAQLGGGYEHRTAPGVFASDLPAAAVAVSGDDAAGRSLAWIAAAAALLPLLWGLSVCVRHWRRSREDVR
ncbi:VWA domain-containing protein [Tessaracoccus palaemonis]|uniref:VWA domain-containing protein n=1 Tax=Tessaracoccus palaemonis TaxID=2829499 RepID=A0ABX8SMI7_9ACTN|nr:VWA domain-containing protein [Tessaracoccus palaemonis]QXT63602.1 VWA domain-containing protein [Tessaracoccus palaemonis]